MELVRTLAIVLVIALIAFLFHRRKQTRILFGAKIVSSPPPVNCAVSCDNDPACISRCESKWFPLAKLDDYKRGPNACHGVLEGCVDCHCPQGEKSVYEQCAEPCEGSRWCLDDCKGLPKDLKGSREYKKCMGSCYNQFPDRFVTTNTKGTPTVRTGTCEEYCARA